MPELPDLEVYSRNLHKRIKKKVVKRVIVSRAKKLNVSANQLKKAIEKQPVGVVRREGKELYLEFENGNVLALHLMLNGKLELSEKNKELKYPILKLDFKDDTRLTLTDPRGFARPALNPEPADAPDALSRKVNPRFLKERLSRKRTNIKNFLLDQDSLRGIGNVYADEILWRARISPFSVCNKIPERKIPELSKSIKEVLRHAAREIGKRNPGTISGGTVDFLTVHHSGKKKSPGGARIRTRKTSGSRTTYYTGEQELFK